MSVIQISNEEEKSIYYSLKFFILLGQCLGILPQEGVTTSLGDLQFKWLSVRVIYTFFMMLFLTASITMCFVQSAVGSFTFDHFVTTVFFIVGLSTLILYLNLARNFASLIKDWCKTDRLMNRNYGYPKTLNIHLKIITIIGVVCVFVDYIFSITFHAVQSLNRTDGDLLIRSNLYFKTTYPAVFYQQTSVNVIGVLASISTWLCTFIWTYNDLFIIHMSTILALRFKQISDCLVSNERKNNSNEFWIKTRENYDRLSVLCKKLDTNISFIILLSFTSNTFFILVQIFYSFVAIDDVLEQIYFFYAFSYLILRLVNVSLYAAWINDESKVPAIILNSLPSATYNLEIRRLLLQISFDNVALTGCKMFKITRGLILSVASAVVTYELVLIQFKRAASS